MEAPTIVIVKAAVRMDMKAIWSAMGEGPDAFNRKLCAIDPEATWETSATHYMIQDMSSTDDKVATWSAMAQNNDLPPLPGWVVWGENGVISAQDAQAAISTGNMFVFPAYGLETNADRDNWRDGVLIGMDLQFVPDEPI